MGAVRGGEAGRRGGPEGRARAAEPGQRAGGAGKGSGPEAQPFMPEWASPSTTRRCSTMNRIINGSIAMKLAAIITG